MARELHPAALEKRIYNMEMEWPSIEGERLSGDKTFEELGIASGEDLAQTNEDLLEVTQIVNGMSMYSTEEVDTGKKWIDGRHIFSKTLNLKTPTINKYVTEIVINDTIELLTNCYGMINNYTTPAGVKHWASFPAVSYINGSMIDNVANLTDVQNAEVTLVGNDIHIRLFLYGGATLWTQYSNVDVVLTIEYVKTEV